MVKSTSYDVSFKKVSAFLRKNNDKNICNCDEQIAGTMKKYNFWRLIGAFVKGWRAKERQRSIIGLNVLAFLASYSPEKQMSIFHLRMITADLVKNKRLNEQHLARFHDILYSSLLPTSS